MFKENYRNLGNHEAIIMELTEKGETRITDERKRDKPPEQDRQNIRKKGKEKRKKTYSTLRSIPQ